MASIAMKPFVYKVMNYFNYKSLECMQCDYIKFIVMNFERIYDLLT